MKLKLLIVTFCLNVLFVAHSKAKNTAGNKDIIAKVSQKPNISRKQTDKRLTPAQVSLHFIKWYCKNQKRLRTTYAFVNGTPGDTTVNYSINFTNVDAYLKSLKVTGYVTIKFLKGIRANFEDAANDLQLHSQNDGPVIKIENDPILQIMEEDELTNHLKQLRYHTVYPTSWTSDYVTVVVNVSKYLAYIFNLKQYHNKWEIESLVPRFN